MQGRLAKATAAAAAVGLRMDNGLHLIHGILATSQWRAVL